MQPACPFCSMPAARIRVSTRLSMYIDDGFPVSPGHGLLIPRRHVQSFFDLSSEEQSDLLGLLGRARSAIQAQHQPDGFNIGINDGLTRWAYDRAFDLGLPTWVRRREMAPLSPAYARFFE